MKLFASKHLLIVACLCLTCRIVHGELRWLQAESEHFTVIYLQPQQDLVPHVLTSAEKALSRLMQLFDYVPSERIIINLHDFSDYGSAGATTVPHSMIRVAVAPLEPGYENIPYTERIQWLIAHELVHIVVNDMSSDAESFARSLFSKAPPEKEQPLSILYSLLTNYSRYTPAWHQEGIAVFAETWLNGGFGRALGNFDEMYFRTQVLERKPFPAPYMLDATEIPQSFLLNTLSYLYGTRFVSFLAAAFGVEPVLSWYSAQADGFYTGQESRFEKTFGRNLTTVWDYFIHTETRFQQRNLQALRTAPLTPVQRFTDKPMGWVTRGYFDTARSQVIFGSHQPHYLTGIYVFDITSRSIARVGTLPTPSLIRIASTAYDSHSQRFFYTTNNNQFYRDVRVLDLVSKQSRVLFKNVRVGDLSVSEKTRELWGVRHAGAKTALVYAAYPYNKLEPVIEFSFGDILHDLAVSPSGRFLAATLHRADGWQAIIVTDLRALKQGKPFTYQVVSEDGSPEFPAWSTDENVLYWSAFTNGVSNIYRFDIQTSQVTALSHTLSGLFRPVYISEKYLLAFEFTTDGFVPVVIPNEPAQRLPAITYFGQKIVDKNPQVTEWALQAEPASNNHAGNGHEQARYSGVGHLRFQSVLPVVSGFKQQMVVGLYTHLADPLFTHDVVFEVGVTAANRTAGQSRFHFRGKYEYNGRLKIELERNAASFYDLFNHRKSGLTGTKVLLENTHYWKFDNPHKVKQTTGLTFYTGIVAINDNLIKVTNPDFGIFETGINSRNIRKAIGSVDNEYGTEWTVTLSGLISRPENPQLMGGMHAEWNYYTPFVAPHNIFHLQAAGGLLHNPENLAIGQFYFGGFGNRHLENKPVKQFREVFRFPGAPVFSIDASAFGKLMLEHNLPPLRFNHLRFGQHYLGHVDASTFVGGLIVESRFSHRWFNVGGQVNFVFKHWFNLESTLSLGAARAWSARGNSTEWFISYKLLRD